MKLGKRHVRRGHLAKAHDAKRPLVARMLAAPPSRARYQPEARVFGVPPARLADLSRTTPWSDGVVTALELDTIPGDAVLVASDGFAFGGTYDDVAVVREAVAKGAERPRPVVVSMDYVIHPIQLVRAAECGADAVLLIARLLDGDAVADLVRAARALALEPVVECATPEEAALAEALEVQVVAVSLRDRDTLRPSSPSPALLQAIERFPRKVALSLSEETDAGDAGRFDAVFVRASALRAGDECA